MAEAVLVLISGLLSAGSSPLMEPFGHSPAQQKHTHRHTPLYRNMHSEKVRLHQLKKDGYYRIMYSYYLLFVFRPKTFREHLEH